MSYECLECGYLIFDNGDPSRICCPECGSATIDEIEEHDFLDTED